MSTRDELLYVLDTIQQGSVEHPVPLNEEELAKNVLMRVSGYARLLEKTNKKGQAVLNIGAQTDHFYANTTTESVAQGFHLGGFVLNSVNFLSLPALYLCAYLLGQKMPLTWVDKMQWNYSGIMVGMALICLFVPVTAPVLAFVMAGSSLAVGSFFLSMAMKEHYVLEQKQEELTDTISFAQEMMQAIVDEATDLRQELEQSNDDVLETLEQEIEALDERYKQQRNTLNVLREEFAHNEQLEQEFSLKNIRRRSFSVTLSALAVIGLVISLFFPPAGVSILTAVALVGAAYVLAPSILKIGRWIADKFTDLKKSSAGYASLENDKPLVTNEIEYSSTSKLLQRLGVSVVDVHHLEVEMVNLVHSESVVSSPASQQRGSEVFIDQLQKNNAEIISEQSEKTSSNNAWTRT